MVKTALNLAMMEAATFVAIIMEEFKVQRLLCCSGPWLQEHGNKKKNSICKYLEENKVAVNYKDFDLQCHFRALLILFVNDQEVWIGEES